MPLFVATISLNIMADDSDAAKIAAKQIAEGNSYDGEASVDFLDLAAVQSERNEFVVMISKNYDRGFEIAKMDRESSELKSPAAAAAKSGVQVLSVAGSAFMRGYQDGAK